MKYSQYNILSEKNHIIYNSLYLTMAKLNDKLFQSFRNNIVADIEKWSTHEYKLLSENGFIVDDSINELNIIKEKYWKNKYSLRTLNITILTTLDCNFGCPYCFEVRCKNSNMSLENENKIYDFLVNKLSQYREINIDWYGGEPLLNVDLIEHLSKRLIFYCEQNNITYNASITTNGYLFTHDIQEKLSALKISSAQITLDGNKEIHNQRRVLLSGKGTYEKILMNIKEACKRFFIDLRVNVDDTNIDKLNELITDLGKIPSDNIDLSICMVTPIGRGTIDVEWEKNITKKIVETYRFATLNNVRVAKLNDMCMEHTRFCVVDSDSQYIISPNGSLYKCGESYIDSSDPGYIGTIKDKGNYGIVEDNLDIWFKDPFAYEECLKCKILPICMGGCSLKRKLKNMSPCISELKYMPSEMLDLVYDIIDQGE